MAARAEADRRRDLEADSDGFRPVRNGASAAGGRTSTGDQGIVPTRNSWAAMAEEDDECIDEDEERQPGQPADDNDDNELADQMCGAGSTPSGGDDQHGHAATGAQDGGNVDGDGQVDEAQLRGEWLAQCTTVRTLERELRAPPALRTRLIEEARASRDAAEARWRAARTPPPLSRRLRWAEAELREAEHKERSHRQELAQHLEQTAKRTRELEERIAVDVARTSRKRAAIEALHAEGAPHQPRPAWTTGQAARVAATGISSDVAPALAAVIERLGTPSGADVEALRQELELCAVSLSRVEGVLREVTTEDQSNMVGGPTRYDISDDSTGDGGDDGGTAGGAGGGDGGGSRPPQAAAVPRWTKPSPNQPWKRMLVAEPPHRTSATAVEEARRLLRGGGPGGASSAVVATGAASAAMDVSDGGCFALQGRSVLQQQHQQAAQQQPPAAADTNDLAEAERRSRLAAQQQVAAVQQGQPQQDEQARQLEEAQRAQRERRQREEIERHQAEIQRAAAAREEEEARERAALLANMSPQERARAEEAQAQLAAVGSQIFGTQAASELAGLVHQRHVHTVAQGAAQSGEQIEVDRLMAMSPEDFAAWEHDRRTSGDVPW